MSVEEQRKAAKQRFNERMDALYAKLPAKSEETVDAVKGMNRAQRRRIERKMRKQP